MAALTLNSFFKKKVDRPIEGVIKADDEADLKVEVEEYVLTDEVEKRLETFLEAYNNYEGANGVWISGFFGSGKSHLLKMLAILLENRMIDGKTVADYFYPKCSDDNEILKNDIKAAVRIPSKSILFNIDQKADVITKTETDALVAVFVKVFDEACGYYGKQAYIAQFERELDRDGLFDKFKLAFNEFAGQTWEFGRERAKRFSLEIDKAYNSVSNQNETGILDKYRTDYHLSIDDFANHVKEYIEKQEPNFRLNFFVDEVGQYIANNEKLMVNLQTVAESLATKCRGRAWVIVTAQNDMSRVLSGMSSKLNTDDYTKIQARFKIRMNLTSADVAEVIQKRLLAKNSEAEKELSGLYNKESDNFKTLFDFEDGSQTYKNFQSSQHFIDCYPFIPYQFPLFQTAIQNLSTHDAFEGRYNSVGERSMLGVFQQVAVNVSQYQVGELATFDMMFEGIRTSLKTDIQRPILNAEKNIDDKDKFAVRVLKALFLVKYIKEFRGTVRNICVLMYPNFNENLSDLTKKVQEALNLLEQQIYIQRTGDIYEYLTNDEKDVEKEIKDVSIEKDEIIKELSTLIFGRIIPTKIRYGEDGKDYLYTNKLDDVNCSNERELAINVISPLNDNQNSSDSSFGITHSIQNIHDLIVVLEPDYRLVEDLYLYKQTKKYIGENNNSQQKESKKKILTDKGIQNSERYNEIQQRIVESLGKAKFYVAGSEIEVSGEQAQSRVIRAFNELIGRTYTNLKMVSGHTYKMEDISSYLNSSQKSLFATDAVSMSEAEKHLLGTVTNSTFRCTVKTITDIYEKIPNGWSLPAILCNIAKLCARGKLEIRQDSNILDDSEIEKALSSTANHSNLILQAQLAFSQAQIRNLKEFYETYSAAPINDMDAKTLANMTSELLTNTKNRIEKLLYQVEKYPFLKALNPTMETISDCSGKIYTWYLTDFSDKQEELIMQKENIIDPIERFMNGIGREIYDNAATFVLNQKANFQYISSDEVSSINETLSDANCYKGTVIQILKDKLTTVKGLINEKVSAEKQVANNKLNELKQKLTSMEQYSKLSGEDVQKVESRFDNCKTKIENQTLIAIVKDVVSNFESNDYTELLNFVIQTSQLKVAVDDTSSTDSSSDNTEVKTQVKKSEIIQAQKISIGYTKPLLSNANEVEDYINSLKQAMLEEINNGKQIQI